MHGSGGGWVVNMEARVTLVGGWEWMDGGLGAGLDGWMDEWVVWWWGGGGGPV